MASWTAGMVSPFILKMNCRILINYECLSVQLVLIKLLLKTKLFSSKKKILKSRIQNFALSKKSLKHRLSILRDHMDFIAKRELVNAKQIAAMSLELITNKDYERKTSEVSKKIVETMAFPENDGYPRNW